MSNIYPAVVGYRDGEEYKLNADELNRPIRELVARTDYLKSRVDQVVSSNGFSSIERPDVELHNPSELLPGMPVYIRPEDGKYAAAAASVLAAPAFSYSYADTEAFAVGVLKSISGNTGTVTLYGKFDLSSINPQTLMVTGETFRPGPYYLSDVEPGRYTKAPTGPAVYMGFFQQGEAHISPQMKDLFEAHLHRSFVLADKPAGHIRVTGSTELDYSYEVEGFEPDDNTSPVAYLNFRGAYTGDPSTQYTFWIYSPDDLVATAYLRWTTDDGSDENLTGVLIGAFDVPIELGNGLSVILEKSRIDYSANNYDILVMGTEQEPGTTWTLDNFGETVRGWADHRIRETMVYSGSNGSPSDCGFRLIGTNTEDESTRSLTITPSGVGDLSTGVNLEVIDPVWPGGIIVPLAQQGGTYQLDVGLWLVITSGTTTTVDANDEWSATIVDAAPGANFEYLVSLDPEMAAYYPPDSRLKLVLEANGASLDVRNEFRSGEGTYKPDQNTIYWWGKTHRYTPFPFDYVDLIDQGEYENAKNLKLYGSTLRTGDTGIVTSLKAAEGGAIEIVDAVSGEPSQVGDLEIRASIGVSVEDTNKSGYSVLKGTNEAGALVSGPVVEKLLPGDNISLTQVAGPSGQGTMRISASSFGFTRSMFTDVTLHNAKQELVPNSQIPFIKLKGWQASLSNNVPTGFTLKFRVPYTLTGQYKLMLYFTMFGLSDVAIGSAPGSQKYAGLKVTYSVVQDFVNVADPANPQLITRNLRDIGAGGVLRDEILLADDVPFGALDLGYNAYDPFLVHNDVSLTPVSGQVVGPFGDTVPKLNDDPEYVTAGDIVTIRVDRQAPVSHIGSAEYIGEIGFIANEWKLLEV